MNYRFVSRQLGLLMLVLSASILLIAAWSGLERWLGDVAETWALTAFLQSIGFGLVIGLVFFRLGRNADDFLGRHEALLLVAMSWLVGAALAGLPFFIWAHISPDAETGFMSAPHPFRSFASCYFEAMSGLTTTGATVLSDIEALPRSLLLWRAVTHWLGGLGIVVLFVAVLPTLGVGGKKLFKVETTGPTSQGVRPRIRETARMLWLIYVGLTLAQAIALRMCGLGWVRVGVPHVRDAGDRWV